MTSTRLWRPGVLVKTRVWVGHSVSRANKIWSRPFLFKDFHHFLFLVHWCVNSMAAAPDRYHIWKIPLIRWYIAQSSKYGKRQLVMENYLGALSQSETVKCFEWITYIWSRNYFTCHRQLHICFVHDTNAPLLVIKSSLSVMKITLVSFCIHGVEFRCNCCLQPSIHTKNKNMPCKKCLKFTA